MTTPDLAQEGRPALCRGVRRSTDPLTGDAVLLFPEGILVMNQTAARVVACCDGTRTIEDIARTLGAEYTGLKSDEIAYLVDDLIAQHLIVRHV